MNVAQEKCPWPTPLRPCARLVAGLILQILMLVASIQPICPDPGTKFEDFAGKFISGALPCWAATVALLFLFPVVIRGSSKQKAAAIILSLLPLVFAALLWYALIEELFAKARILLG